jgi:hypothetical protein
MAIWTSGFVVADVQTGRDLKGCSLVVVGGSIRGVEDATWVTGVDL